MATNNAINAPLPLAASQGGTGLASLTAHGILVGEGTSNVNPITLSNGQLLIGSTGADPVATTLTAGSNISISTGVGSITISGTGTVPFNTVTGTSQAMAVDNGYVANNAALVTLTLPSTAAVGDSVQVFGLGAGGWTIAQNAGQLIHFGSQVTTTGTGGSLSSTNQYDNVTLVCIVANTTWSTKAPEGNLTYV